jgi:sulfotransferase
MESLSQYNNESALFFKEEQRVRILQGIFSGYYEGYPDVVFDTNRRWCAYMALLDKLFPGAKVVACVRPVVEVVDSFERLFLRDPTQISRVMSATNTTLADRVSRLMGHNAVVGYSLNALSDAYHGPFQHNLIVVEFRHLVTNPRSVLEDLHRLLGEPWFEYDLSDVQTPPHVDVFDEFLATPHMHRVESQVAYTPYTPVLPAYIARSLPKPFWVKHEAPASSAPVSP